MKIMAFGPMTSWQIDWATMETVRDFIFRGSKITADDGYSHEIKRCLLVWRKAMKILDSIFKSRDITLLKKKKFSIIKATIFPGVMYGCDSCTIRSCEQWRIDGFELWCWTRRLRVPWTERSSKQSMLKEINPEYSLEGLMLTLKLQYFGYLMRQTDLLEKTLMLGNLKAKREGDDRWWDGWMASPTQWTWVWPGFASWWWTGKPGMLQSMGPQRVRHNWVTELTLRIHKNLQYVCT